MCIGKGCFSAVPTAAAKRIEFAGFVGEWDKVQHVSDGSAFGIPV
jgi:hypothetical protein